MRESGFYHVCSEGLDKEVIFSSQDDFVAGMNYVAVCSCRFEVRIMCFCLMANHFHFILTGSYEECWKFGCEFKRMCAMLMRRCQDIENGMKEVEVQVKQIGNKNYLENAVAYVLRNPLAAGFRLMPDQYPWGSGDMYFRGCHIPEGKRADCFKVRELEKTLKSNYKVPGNFVIDSNGMISPLCYIDYKSVETLFGNPARLLGILSAKKEAEFEVFLGIADSYNPDIEELRFSVKELIREEFGVKAVSQLSMEQKIRLCSLMHRNFRASRKQIALITRLNMETINTLI